MPVCTFCYLKSKCYVGTLVFLQTVRLLSISFWLWEASVSLAPYGLYQLIYYVSHTPTNTPSLFRGQTWAKGVSDTEISMVTACSVFLWCMCFVFPEARQFLAPCAHVCLYVPVMEAEAWGYGTALRAMCRERKHQGWSLVFSEWGS